MRGLVSRGERVHRHLDMLSLSGAEEHINLKNTFKGVDLKLRVKSKCTDFPGAPVVKNPPANAGDVGKIPHATKQLDLHATTSKPRLE